MVCSFHNQHIYIWFVQSLFLPLSQYEFAYYLFANLAVFWKRGDKILYLLLCYCISHCSSISNKHHYPAHIIAVASLVVSILPGEGIIAHFIVSLQCNSCISQTSQEVIVHHLVFLRKRGVILKHTLLCISQYNVYRICHNEGCIYHYILNPRLAFLLLFHIYNS